MSFVRNSGRCSPLIRTRHQARQVDLVSSRDPSATYPGSSRAQTVVDLLPSALAHVVANRVPSTIERICLGHVTHRLPIRDNGSPSYWMPSDSAGMTMSSPCATSALFSASSRCRRVGTLQALQAPQTSSRARRSFARSHKTFQESPGPAPSPHPVVPSLRCAATPRTAWCRSRPPSHLDDAMAWNAVRALIAQPALVGDADDL